MSRSTPRKSRHRQHASTSGPRQVGVSDYESDAAQYLENREAALPPNPNPPRDNTELSLRVLRRHQPSVRSIIAIAANAVVYNIAEAAQGWEKHGAEGTMFVCEQEPIVAPTGQVLPRACVFVLNRRSMDNITVDLLNVTDCEVIGELIVFRLEDTVAGANHQGQEGAARKKVIGLWLHADTATQREGYAELITAEWKRGRQALDALIQEAAAASLANRAFAAAPQEAASTESDSGAGKRLSMTELFGRKNGV